MNHLKSKITHYTWDLAFFNFEDNDIASFNLRKLHIVKNPYKNKWFADPFVLSDDGATLQLLVEEFDYSINRGRIARLEIDKSKQCIVDCSIILDLPTHLSFPSIYRKGGAIYVHPENSESGASYIYRYDEKEDKMVDPICVLNEPVTDAIIVEQDGHYYMYATKMPNPNGDKLDVYISNNFFGPYTLDSTELFENCQARMAGYFFYFKDKVIRPAQDCNGAYGKAVVFYDGHTIIQRLEPETIKYCGIHTFNVYNKTGIVDLKKWDYPILVAVKNYVKKIVK